MPDQEEEMEKKLAEWAGGSGPGPSATANTPKVVILQKSPIIPLPTEILEPVETDSAPPPTQTRQVDNVAAETARRNGFRMAIVGGPGVGKSYLFQGLVWRSASAANSCALVPFLNAAKGRSFITKNTDIGMNSAYWTPITTDDFQKSYNRWMDLGSTYASAQYWYRLRLELPTGWFSYTPVDVDFLDASGEELCGDLPGRKSVSDYAKPELDERRRIWGLLSNAQVMVFCLPMWAAFSEMPLPDGRTSALIRLRLKQFADVVKNFRQVREERGIRHPVHTMLALTMADDPGISLKAVQSAWIHDWLGDDVEKWRMMSSTDGGASKYIDNARCISEIVLKELLRHPDPTVSRLPGMLDFGYGAPFVVPISALHGEILREIEKEFPIPSMKDKTPSETDVEFEKRRHAAESSRDGLLQPRPAHVELPLLVALCHATNALM